MQITLINQTYSHLDDGCNKNVPQSNKIYNQIVTAEFGERYPQAVIHHPNQRSLARIVIDVRGYHFAVESGETPLDIKEATVYLAEWFRGATSCFRGVVVSPEQGGTHQLIINPPFNSCQRLLFTGDDVLLVGAHCKPQSSDCVAALLAAWFGS